MGAPAGSRPRSRIHMREFVRSDACTTRAAAKSIDPWQTADRVGQMGSCEIPSPRTRTRGTPNCRAWKAHPDCRDGPSPRCGHSYGWAEAAAVQDHLRASLPQRSDRTAWSKAGLHNPDARHFGPVRSLLLLTVPHRTRPLPFAAV